MFNGKTLHICLTGDLNTCPATFRRVFEIPSSTQQKLQSLTQIYNNLVRIRNFIGSTSPVSK